MPRAFCLSQIYTRAHGVQTSLGTRAIVRVRAGDITRPAETFQAPTSGLLSVQVETLKLVFFYIK